MFEFLDAASSKTIVQLCFSREKRHDAVEKIV